MKHSFDGYNYLIRLDKGEKLTESMERFIRESSIEGGWISGLGTAYDVSLGFYSLGSKLYKWQTFGHMMEIVSLTGNLAFDQSGKMGFHLHGVFADDEYHTVGGHLREFIVGTTAEVFVHRSYQPMRRKTDESVGLQILDLG